MSFWGGVGLARGAVLRISVYPTITLLFNLTEVTCMPLESAARHTAEPMAEISEFPADSRIQLPMNPFPPTTRIFLRTVLAAIEVISRLLRDKSSSV